MDHCLVTLNDGDERHSSATWPSRRWSVNFRLFGLSRFVLALIKDRIPEYDSDTIESTSSGRGLTGSHPFFFIRYGRRTLSHLSPTSGLRIIRLTDASNSPQVAAHN